MHNLVNFLTATFATTLPLQLAQMHGLTGQVDEYANPSQSTWERFIGQHGALAVSLVVGGIFITFFILNFVRDNVRTKRMERLQEEHQARENKRRDDEEADNERRHKELVACNTSNVNRLIDLNIEVAKVSMRSTAAIEQVSTTLSETSRLLSERYCLMNCHHVLRKFVSELTIKAPHPPLRQDIVKIDDLNAALKNTEPEHQ